MCETVLSKCNDNDNYNDNYNDNDNDHLRDLLGNIQLPEHPAEGGDEASDGEEERDPREWD